MGPDAEEIVMAQLKPLSATADLPGWYERFDWQQWRRPEDAEIPDEMARRIRARYRWIHARQQWRDANCP
jgi:hypothetical protein